MGGGSWTSTVFDSYTKRTKGVDAVSYASSTSTAQELYRSTRLDPILNPKNVMRECLDSEEHPNTFPIILALDVTGSMGEPLAAVAKQLGNIMESLYADATMRDIEFCIMAIGDLAYDDAPIQISQFESDIRIAEQLDKVWFERGGGSNKWESYTAAWYMGVNHCKLDCWGRGEKGVIITLGDERLNPVLNAVSLRNVCGDSVQHDIETKDLFADASKKYHLYHISIDDGGTYYRRGNTTGLIDESWRSVLGQNYLISTINDLPTKITEIVKTSYPYTDNAVSVAINDGISW